MRKLYRSDDDRMIAGVLGGLADFFGIDATIIRLLFVAGTLLSIGTFILLYIAAVFIVPNERNVY
ncbi:MAG TPA: PspC domain-containing protein [Bacillota bacterium]|nr:PspC domain-containing protein [Bacillota bacterium]